MTAEPPLTLREVARRLGQVGCPQPGKPAVSKLLGLLKTGELKAGFEFPGTKVCWIPIPTSYWTGVSSHKFGSLRYIEHDKRKTGTYEVRISDFVDEYMQVVSQQVLGTASDSTAALRDELKKALFAAQKAYEVGITAEGWANYLERHQISVSEVSQKSSAGRREKTSWSHLTPIIAAHMMTLDKRPDETRDHLYIATRILEIAKKEGIRDLPVAETLRDIISKVFARADDLTK